MTLRTRLAKRLHAWALRLAPRADPPVRPDPPFTFETPSHPIGALDTRAVTLVREAERTWTDASGEYKRHQVYARLLKEFPGVSKSAISRAIESGVEVC